MALQESNSKVSELLKEIESKDKEIDSKAYKLQLMKVMLDQRDKDIRIMDVEKASLKEKIAGFVANDAF